MNLASLVVCLCVSLHAPRPADRWVGEDKLKHFLASFVVTSFSASGARAAGLDPGASVWVGAGVGVGVGAWKELRDSAASGRHLLAARRRLGPRGGGRRLRPDEQVR